MENVTEFIGNHTMMVVAWAFTLAMLIFTERMKGGKSVTAAEATRLINKEDAVVLDIRAHKDFSTGHLTNSINIPLADFDRRMTELDQYKDKPIIVVCNMGQTAGTACRKMKSAGFTQAMRLTGGISEWRHQSMPVVTK